MQVIEVIEQMHLERVNNFENLMAGCIPTINNPLNQTYRANTTFGLEIASAVSATVSAIWGLGTVAFKGVMKGTAALTKLPKISKMPLKPKVPRRGVKPRNKPPSPLLEAEGRSHTILEKFGQSGQYTTYNVDGTWKQYRGAGSHHGGIPRPNVKESTLNITPEGKVFMNKPKVRPARFDEIPRGP